MSTTKPVFLCVCVVCLLAPLIGAAQVPYDDDDAIFPLRVGVPAEANINGENPFDRYSFDVPDGANVTVTMEATSGDLDPLLTLTNPDGDVQANDDRAPGDRNAEIDLEDVVGGTFTVEATRFDREDGDTTGTYLLTLAVSGVAVNDPSVDLLLNPPPFSVDFTQVEYRTFGAGSLEPGDTPRYYAVGGDRGDLLRAILTVTGDGDLEARVSILTPSLASIGEAIQLPTGEVLGYATLPARDWYLIEVAHEAGSGSFSLFVDGLAGIPVMFSSDEPIAGTFTLDSPGATYIVEGKMDDQLFVNVRMAAGAAASPQIRLLDVRQRELESANGARIAFLRTTLPRSGTYIVEINNTQPQTFGEYNVGFTVLPTDPDKLTVTPADYNTAYKGVITPETPRELYAFDGKAGELVTLEMRAADGSNLDALLAIMDETLTELVSNDDARAGRDARINQFALPRDGRYYVLAGRSDLVFGETSGAYDLALSAGAIALEDGTLTVTASWAGEQDLNLFVREPSGRVLSWSNPAPASGGVLQVDSNTNCETISSQPVEHIYWEPAEPPIDGDYEVWAWYQAACGREVPLNFSLTIARGPGPEQEIVHIATDTLTIGQRYELEMRVAGEDVFVLGTGRVTLPTPQQRASEGGDLPLRFGEPITGSISDQIYARFYQFDGIEGETIQIDAEAVTGTLDPLLILRDDAENNLAPPADDISEENRNARLTATLPYTGRYVVAVTRFGVRDGLTTGDYRLTLRREAATTQD